MITYIFLTTLVVSDISKFLNEKPYLPWQQITINPLVKSLIGLSLTIGIVLSFFFLIWGGINWILAAGDKEKLIKSQTTVTGAIIGLAVIFSAWAILNLLKYFFGITSPQKTTIPTPQECLTTCSSVIKCTAQKNFCVSGCHCICDDTGNSASPGSGSWPEGGEIRTCQKK